MISVSEVVLTAVGFLGIGTAGLATPPSHKTANRIVDEDDPVPSISLLSAGEPYFEAVATELRKSGYLDG
ncbi:hypothetical protein MMMDOFMJ_0673 [Methylobacterium gnaphalii]|nr:hypothetical protein MMMDOFMJ_0673 [Methylobacterium gnaphalii]GLS50074.1 hypothetical protein GCM10007885_29260 [Methylobacterium gnaphalii]